MILNYNTQTPPKPHQMRLNPNRHFTDGAAANTVARRRHHQRAPPPPPARRYHYHQTCHCQKRAATISRSCKHAIPHCSRDSVQYIVARSHTNRLIMYFTLSHKARSCDDALHSRDRDIIFLLRPNLSIYNTSDYY